MNGNEKKMHEDPNKGFVLDTIGVLFRLPSVKFPIQRVERTAGKVVAAKMEKEQCVWVGDIFGIFERTVNEHVLNEKTKSKLLDDLRHARNLYGERFKTEAVNIYLDDPRAVQKYLMDYVYMIMGLEKGLNFGETDHYRDPSTNKIRAIKIERDYVERLERLAGVAKIAICQLEFRRGIFLGLAAAYSAGQYTYDFADRPSVVKAATAMALEDVVFGETSLVQLLNGSKEDNRKLLDRIFNTMLTKFGYCEHCAKETMEYYVTLK